MGLYLLLVAELSLVVGGAEDGKKGREVERGRAVGKCC